MVAKNSNLDNHIKDAFVDGLSGRGLDPSLLRHRAARAAAELLKECSTATSLISPAPQSKLLEILGDPIGLRISSNFDGVRGI